MTEERVERRLAAILVADIVGYSRQMDNDEIGTYGRLKVLWRDILDPKTQQFGGRIFKNTGDGALVEFPSAIDAVQCALDMQQALARHNDTVSDEQRTELRIGINLGDVIIQDEDIFGDGVNVAARLEGLAAPGAVCISESIYGLVQGKTRVAFQDLGKKALKNIADPVQVYQIRPADCRPDSRPDSRSQPASRPAPISERPVVAVLPFNNMSGDPDQEYFSDGLTEDIITALSHWRSIPVIARNSTFTYKGQAVRIQTVARELGARYILEGSVRKAGTRLRITAQLIDAETGHHVWANKFDRQLEDIFDIQDEITNTIAATIVPELETFEKKRSSVKRTEDLSAWDFYLRGLETFYDETCAGTAVALGMFQAATRADPGYSDAWARLGWCYAKLVMHGCTDNPDPVIEQGFEAARRGVALDEASALAHMSIGTVHIWADETDLGLAEAKWALELNPNYAHAAMAYGNRLDLVGDTQEGIAQMERALMLNPRDPIRWRYKAYLSRAYLSLEDYERACEWGKKAAMLRPDLPEALFRYAICLAHLDRIDEARNLLDQCTAIDPAYVAGKANWRPYPDDARNRHILDGVRRHNLLGRG
ncbi:MAG: adenylate/guanylate cyclase domain-containing protein [Fimbriimonadaceae bacterium]|nr:adenylate/guanylate cyclase domain-containing protein [Alphaproteobacteria bacterium]